MVKWTKNNGPMLTLLWLMIDLQVDKGGGTLIRLKVECQEYCKFPIASSKRRWCRVNCPLQPLLIKTPVSRPLTTPYGGNGFKPRPTWQKVTLPEANTKTDELLPTKFIRPSTKAPIPTRKTPIPTRKTPIPTWGKITLPTTQTTKKVTTILKTSTSSVTSEPERTTTTTTTGTTKTHRYIRPSNNKTLVRMMDENIDTQNLYFKLAGGLLATCLVIFIVCFLWRSMKKPHRVSFTEEPIIVMHTGEGLTNIY